MSMLRSIVYLAGFSAVGGVLFYFVGGTSTSDGKTHSQMRENQGILARDMSDAERNNMLLMKKIQAGAGIDPDKKS